MSKEDVLALDTRRAIYREIDRHPGLQARDLERATEIPLSTLRYHVDYLERHDLVESRKDGAFRRFYVRQIGRSDRRIIEVLRRDRARAVLLYILEKEDASAWHSDISKRFAHWSASTLAENLAILVDRGIVARIPAGRRSRYRVLGPDAIDRVLVTYRESFLGAIARHVVDIVYGEDES